MKTERLLKAFLEQAGLPVYLEDQVPAGAPPAYAAYRCAVTRWGEAAPAHVTGWFHGEAANAEAAAFLDRMAALVPEGGALLEGPLWVLRGAEFLTLQRDGEAIGGRVNLELKSYVTIPDSTKEV